MWHNFNIMVCSNFIFKFLYAYKLIFHAYRLRF